MLFNPLHTWRWLQLEPKELEGIESRADSVVFPRRWNIEGIRQRLTLSQPNILGTDDVCEKIMSATGGWPILVDCLFDRCDVNNPDPRPVITEIQNELNTSDSSLCKLFKNSVGLEIDSLPIRLLKALIREQVEFPLELLEPDILGDEPNISKDRLYSTVEYLYRMSCISKINDTIIPDPTLTQVLVNE